jgi:hypothetical protein
MEKLVTGWGQRFWKICIRPRTLGPKNDRAQSNATERDRCCAACDTVSNDKNVCRVHQ